MGVNDSLIFQTNGMFIMSMIETFHPEYKTVYNGYIYKENDLLDASNNKSKFIIPIFMKNILPVHEIFGEIYIKIDTDNYLSDNTLIYIQSEKYIQ